MAYSNNGGDLDSDFFLDGRVKIELRAESENSLGTSFHVNSHEIDTGNHVGYNLDISLKAGQSLG